MRKLGTRAKIMAYLLTLVMILSLIPANLTEATDTSDHWANTEITKWKDKQLITGYPDGTFRPDHPITRAEFFTLINRVFGYEEISDVPFSDVPTNAWYYNEIGKAVAAGYVSGYPDGTVKPNNYITRQEAAKVVAFAFSFDEAKSVSASTFKDTQSIGSWAQNHVGVMYDRGFIRGYPDGTFGPEKNITRGETVKLLDNVTGDIYNVSGTYTGDISGNLVVNTPGVTLKNMTISGDLYLTQGIGNGDITLENLTVLGTTFISGGGANSIHIIDSTLSNLKVNKSDNTIRIIAKGSTITDVYLQSGATLVQDDTKGQFSNILVSSAAKISLSGDFQAITIETPGAQLEILKGTTKTLTITSTAAASKLSLTAGVIIETMTTNSATKVLGTGTIKTAIINTNGTTFIAAPDSITLKDGVTTKVGDKEVTESTSLTPIPTPSPAPTPAVDVTGVSLNVNTLNLIAQGDTQTLTATISPTNATNKTVTWSSSNEAVATVVNGIVTPLTAGTTTITVTTQDGNYQATCTVTVTDEVSVETISELTTALNNNALRTINLNADLTGNVTATRTSDTNFTLNFNEYTLTGNLSITAANLTQIDLNGTATNSIDGDLTVDASNATVNNNINITGDIDIKGVSDSTWNQNGNANRINVTADGGSLNYTSGTIPQGIAVRPITVTRPLILRGNLSPVPVSIQTPAKLEIDPTATPPEITVEEDATDTDIENLSPTPVPLLARAPVSIGGGVNVNNASTGPVTVRQVRPLINPPAGPVAFDVTQLQLFSQGADAIYYTVDGSDPETSVTGSTMLYEDGNRPVISEAITVKAIAVRNGFLDSSISTATYTQAKTADLTSLALTGNPANYTFVSDKYNYTAVTVAFEVDSLIVTPAGLGVITLDGTPVTTGSPSAPIALEPGVEKTITIIAAETGKSPKTYTIKITRALPKEITAVQTLTDITVNYGTPLTGLLPETVQVTLDDSSTETLAVTWDNGNPTYDASMTGTYTFTGTLILVPGIENSANHQATVNVIVEPLLIDTIINPRDISVSLGTPLIGLLPPTIQVTLDDTSMTNLAVTWDNGTPVYDANTAGTYLFTGTLTLPDNIINPEGYTATVSVTVDPLEIVSVETLSDITVDYGTPLTGLLPTTVQVTLDDTSTTNLAVTWDNGIPVYDANTAGTYLFTGTLTLPDNIINPEGFTATVSVIVSPAEVTAVQTLSDISVAYGTPIATVKSQLPATVEVTLDDTFTTNLAVTWDNGTPVYDSNTIGSYTFKGTLTLTDNMANTANHEVTVLITVNPLEVTNVSSLADTPVAYGTPLETVESLLPTTVEVTLDDTLTTELAVTWDSSTPVYDPLSAGTYTFHGTLTLTGDMANTANHTASVNIIVSPLEIVSVETLTDITVAYGTPITGVLPTTVEVTLDDTSTTNLAVTWNNGIPVYDANTAGTYIFTGTITLVDNIANTANHTASLAVTVSPLEIVSVETLTDITVDYGTPITGVLPTTVQVTLDDTSTSNLAVTWDNGIPAYDANTAGTYVFTGTIMLVDNIINPEGYTATVNLIVTPLPTYTITIAEVQGGTATVTTIPDGEAIEQTPVTVNISNIETGKLVANIEVLAIDSTVIPVTVVNVGEEYTFEMPAQPVTITVTLEEEQLLPYATNVYFTGTLRVGETLTGHYTFNANSAGDAESLTTFKWIRASNDSGSVAVYISGATSDTYVIGENLVDKYIAFEVTVKDENGNVGQTVQSIYLGPVAPISITGVSIDQEDQTILQGDSVQLTATVTPPDATVKTVTWASDDDTIAFVDNTGLVTGVAPGTTTITVTTNDGGFQDTIEITVTEQPAPINSASVTITEGSAVFTYTFFEDLAQTIEITYATALADPIFLNETESTVELQVRNGDTISETTGPISFAALGITNGTVTYATIADVNTAFGVDFTTWANFPTHIVLNLKGGIAPQEWAIDPITIGFTLSDIQTFANLVPSTLGPFWVNPETGTIRGSGIPSSLISIVIGETPYQTTIDGLEGPPDTYTLIVDPNTTNPGTQIIVTDGITTRTHTITDLSMTNVDRGSNIITGTAAAGTLVKVELVDWVPLVGPTFMHTRTVEATDGTWTVDYGLESIAIDQLEVRASQEDAKGNQTLLINVPSAPDIWLDQDHLYVPVYEDVDVYFNETFRLYLGYEQFEETLDLSHFELDGILSGLTIDSVTRDPDFHNEATITISGILNISHDDWNALYQSGTGHMDGYIIVKPLGHTGSQDITAQVRIQEPQEPLAADPQHVSVALYDNDPVPFEQTFDLRLGHGYFYDNLTIADFDLDLSELPIIPANINLSITAISENSEYEHHYYVTVAGTLNISEQDWDNNDWQHMTIKIIAKDSGHSELGDLTATVYITPPDTGWQPDSQFIVSLSSNSIHGWGWPISSGVDIEVTDTLTHNFTTGTDEFGNFEFSTQTFTFEPGQLVTVTVGTDAKTHTVKHLAVTQFDTTNNLINGEADPGSEVTVIVWLPGLDWDDYPRLTVTPSPSGIWIADFDSTFNLEPGMSGIVEQRDENGCGTQMYWYIPNTAFEVLHEENIIAGYDFAPNTAIGLTINSYPVPLAGLTTDSSGFFEITVDPGTFNITTGNIIEVTVADTTKTHVVTALSNLLVDRVTGIVSGLAEPGSTVNIQLLTPNPGGYGPPVIEAEIDLVVDGTGTWSHDFNMAIGDDVTVYVRQFDEDGDTTVIRDMDKLDTGWQPDSQFMVSLSSNSIHGWGWPISSGVDIEVTDTLTHNFTTGTDEFGNFEFSTQTFTFEPGQLVTVTVGTDAKTHTVKHLAVTQFDTTNNLINGEADPGSEVTVIVWLPGLDWDDYPRLTVTPSPSGIWIADFDSTFNLEPGMSGIVEQRDENGCGTQMYWYIPNTAFEVLHEENIIAGYDFAPNTAIGLTINSYPVPLAGLTTDSSGFFEITVDPGTFNITTGNIIEVTVADTTKTHVVTALSNLLVDRVTGIVSGLAEPGSTVNIQLLTPNPGGYGPPVIEAEIDLVVDGTGTWSHDFNMAIGDDVTVYVRQFDEDGDTTVIRETDLK